MLTVCVQLCTTFIVFFSVDLPNVDFGVINESISEGDTAILTCQASGTPIPSINWYFNGALANDTKYMISELSLNPTTKSNTLKIKDSDSSDIGKYTCNSTNVVSSDNSSGVLAVNGESVCQLLKRWLFCVLASLRMYYISPGILLHY